MTKPAFTYVKHASAADLAKIEALLADENAFQAQEHAVDVARGESESAGPDVRTLERRGGEYLVRVDQDGHLRWRESLARCGKCGTIQIVDDADRHECFECGQKFGG